MAANYWDSTQAKYWSFSKTDLSALRAHLASSHQQLYTKYPMPERRLVSIYIQQNLIKLARRMNLRQQALSTAQVYIKRFYLRVEVRKTNPYLIMATAVYLACKMEECPQHIRHMLGEAARQWPELGVTESSKIGECEFALISTLSSRLILHHPYRSLGELTPLFGLSTEEQNLAQSVINDSYCTDLPLLYPPHIIAIAAIFLAIVLRPTGSNIGLQSYSASPTGASPTLASPSPGGPFSNTAMPTGNPALSASAAQQALLGGLGGLQQARPKLAKLIDWLAESKVDMAQIVDATQEMVSLYQAWEEYSERAVKEAISRFVSGGGK